MRWPRSCASCAEGPDRRPRRGSRTAFRRPAAGSSSTPATRRGCTTTCARSAGSAVRARPTSTSSGSASTGSAPGRPMSMYHHEAGQEDFLVLRGTALLVVEGHERPLAAWDLVHCPPRTPHTIVATGDEPALILAVGARVERASARYRADETARRHGAGVERDTASPAEPYARFAPPRPGPPSDVFRGLRGRDRRAHDGAAAGL